MAEDAQPPKLTMPEAESAAVLAAYQSAEVILEYGTGGSTVLAADLPGRRVFSVESSAEWLAMMQDWFTAQPPKAQLVLHHANIGPTRKWGYPASTDRVDRWALYPVSVWDRPRWIWQSRFQGSARKTITKKLRQRIVESPMQNWLEKLRSPKFG